MKVGTVVKLKVACLGNPAGAYGVVFYDYGNGSQAIFENGNYDGFSEVHQIEGMVEKDYFLKEIGFALSLKNYEFKNVLQVESDYRKGIFDIVLRRKI